MVSASFDYVRVDSYDGAIQALTEFGDDAKVIAGGQSLVPMMNLRLARPGLLVDINRADSRQPAVDGSLLHLPALTRHRWLLESSLVEQHCPLLAAAAAEIGNVRVRSRGTIGGSLAHADPTAELATCALTLDATIVVRGPRGERRIQAADFFVTYLTTALEPDEVVTDVYVPVATRGQGWSFREMVRRASDFAMVAVAARLDVEADGTIRAVSVSLAGVADRVVAVDAGPLSDLVGTRADQQQVGDVALTVSNSVDPDGDVHCSGAYRRRLVEVLTRRALSEAFDRATERGTAT